MPHLEFSQLAQHWVAVVLIWIGLGTLAGLLARLIVPVREPSHPLPALALGIAGSAVGLFVLSRCMGARTLDPISPLGFFAAGGGAGAAAPLPARPCLDCQEGRHGQRQQREAPKF